MRRIGILVLAWIFLLNFSCMGFCGDPRLTDIKVTNTRDNLILYLTLTDCFTEEMNQAILSGVPTSFSIHINLYQVKRFWRDAQLADMMIRHTIKFDHMKKEFTVARTWDKNGPHVTQSFEEAQQMMSKIDNLEVIQLSKLNKGSQYQLCAKAELSEINLPFYLHYILFFVSLWDFETDWHAVDFLY